MKNLNKLIFLFTAVFISILIISCDKKVDDSKGLKEKIIQLDKDGWEAWKHKNGKWFEQNTTPNFVSVSADGVSSKTEVITATISNCKVNSYELKNIKFVKLSDKSVLLTYIVLQNGTCNGTKLNSKLQAAANYILQNDKWLEAFYMESKIE
jgi:hypothetical protein